VYSSGAGIALALTLRHFLGLTWDCGALCIDPVMPSALDGMRARTSVRGHQLDVTYRVGACGHGVNAVALNGEQLPFACAGNPHRRGAARIPAGAFLDRLTRTRNSLAIDLG
jgi:cellobiose phosphorylase